MSGPDQAALLARLRRLRCRLFGHRWYGMPMRHAPEIVWLEIGEAWTCLRCGLWRTRGPQTPMREAGERRV